MNVLLRTTAPALSILAAVFSVLLAAGCGGSRTPAEGAPTEAPAPFVETDWPTYHGAPNLAGVAEADFPSKPDLAWRHGAGPAIVNTPVAASGRIFFAGRKGLLTALDTEGAPLWTRRIPRETQPGAPPRDETFDAPLAAVDDLLLVPAADGVLYALDATTGETRWSHDTDGTLLGTPGFGPLVDGVRPLYLLTQDEGMLICLDSNTGAVRWEAEAVARCDGSPGIGAEVAVFGSCDAALHVRSLKDGKARADIPIDEESQVAGGVPVVDGRAYSGSRSGKVICVDVAAGKTIWTNEDAEDEVFTTPAVGTDSVVFGAADGRVYAIARDTGVLRWKTELTGEPPSPVIAGGTVVVSSGGVIHGLDLVTGQLRWSIPVSDEITGPAIVGNRIVVGCDDGSVAAYQKGQ